MAIQYSIQKMVSDGTLSTIALGIQYLQRNDIYIRIAGVETPQSGAPSGYTWSFLDNTTLKILPVIPNGTEVVVYRRTDVDAMYNIYSQNAQFDESTIDENNQQLLYIAQEYLEQGIPGTGVDTIEFLRDDGTYSYYRLKRTDGSYSDEFAVPSASNASRVITRESLRRSYAEAGYNLVAGSFQVGFALVNTNDVALDEITGKAFSGPAGTYPENTGTAGFVDESSKLLRAEVAMRRFSAVAAATQTYYDGELVYIQDRKQVFRFQSSRNLIAGQAQSEITFDDTLHILVVGGGMLQFADWQMVRSKQVSNATRFAGKLKDRTSAISIDCYGDSITFGQALADTVGATNQIGVPTGFGDGSTHDHWRYNNNYPQWIASFLAENVYQTSSINNYGYSGDRAISGYLRHRVISGSDAATIMYGVNDCLFGTSNGLVPGGLSAGGLYSVENYALALRLFAAKQIMQGKAVTILGTAPFASVSGYDGSHLAASRLTRAYNAAAKRVADEFGCRFVDVCQDVFTQYGIMELTQEGTHLGEDGLKIAGERIAAALVTVETENRVSHGSVLIANPNLNCVLTKDTANVLPNASSTTPRGTLDNQPTTMVISTEWLTIPFYAETDSLVMFVNGSCSAAGATFDIRLDYGALQSDYHFQHAFLSGKPTASKQCTKSSSFNRDNINISDDTHPFLIVANRGWHSLSIRKVSGTSSVLLGSLTFLSLESVLKSDVLGVTAHCSVSAAALDSGAVNVASVTQDYPGEFGVLFENPMANNKFTIVVDVNETAADPITITTRYKNIDSCYIAFNKWNGTAWVRFIPTMFTVSTVGGR